MITERYYNILCLLKYYKLKKKNISLKGKMKKLRVVITIETLKLRF